MASRLERGDRYSQGAIVFHWTIAVLVVINLALGLTHDYVPRDWNVIPVHKSIGLTVLVLSIGRLAWRLMHRPPALPFEMAGWEKFAAKTVHWLLYALMLLLPLTGWAFSSFQFHADRPPPTLSWFWLFNVPLLPVGSDLAHTSRDLHTLLGYLMTALVVLHVAAALRHHFLLKDRVLLRMWPGRG